MDFIQVHLTSLAVHTGKVLFEEIAQTSLNAGFYPLKVRKPHQSHHNHQAMKSKAKLSVETVHLISLLK